MRPLPNGWTQPNYKREKNLSGSNNKRLSGQYHNCPGDVFLWRRCVKGTVQQKLTGVLSGINRKLMICHCSDGYSFFN
jgi:hypothetical protein